MSVSGIRPTNTASLEEVRELLRYSVRTLAREPDAAAQLPPTLLWGAPGVGKSTVIRELCAEEGIGFIDIRLAQRDPVDIRGLPVPKDDAVHWLLAADWPRDPESRGILLFDELTAADRSLQVAVYELILDRRLGTLYQLPPGWYVCAAGNRVEDGAVATGLSSALANRFTHLELEPDLEGWIRWGQGEGIHPDVLAFLRFRPECFFSMEGDTERGWPSPRSWTRVSRVLHDRDAGWLEARHTALLMGGLLGPEVGGELNAFLDWRRELPDVPAMLRGTADVVIPERADARYALCAAAVHHLWHGPDAGSEPLIAGFFRFTAALGSDFATMALTDALTGPDERSSRMRAERLFGHPAFQEWSARHGEALARHWGEAG